MTPGLVLSALSGRGIRLYVDGGFLRYHGPAGAFDSVLRSSVKEHRQALIEDWMCRRCEQVQQVLYGFGAHLCRRCFEEER